MSESSRRNVPPGGARGRGRARPVPRPGAPPSVGGESMSSVTSQLSTLSVTTTGTTQPVDPDAAARIAAGAAAAVPEAQIEEITALKPKIPFGTVGNRISLRTNWYRVVLHPHDTVTVHRYEIEIIRPRSERRIDKDVNREVFWRAVKENSDFFGKLSNLVYDDARCLWSQERLQMDRGMVTIDIKGWGDRVDYVITIKYTSTFSLDMRQDDAVRCMSVQFLDALFTQRIRCPQMEISKRFYPFGRSVYLIAKDNEERSRFTNSIGPGIEAWNGIHGAVKVGCDGQPFYNCDVSATAFAKLEIRVADFFIEVLNDAAGGRGQRINLALFKDQDQCDRLAMDERNRKKLKAALTGLTLTLLYGDDTTRTKHFRFVDVGQPASRVRFDYQERNASREPVGEPKEVSVVEYFFRIKGINLQFPNLPVLQVGPRQKRIFIPMELLAISDKPQKIKRNLTEFQKASLLRWCSYAPLDRAGRIDYMVKEQAVHDCPFINNYGVEIDQSFLELEGRVLPAPKIAMQKDEINKYCPVTVREGGWKLPQPGFTRCHDNMVFCIVNVARCIDSSAIHKPMEVLMRACELFGMRFATQEYLCDPWDPSEAQVLPAMMQYFKEKTAGFFGSAAQPLVIFLMDRKEPRTYGLIKKVCDLEFGIPSQVLLTKTFLNMAKNRAETSATAHNICLKVNVKMGGINNVIYPEHASWIKFVDPDSPTLHVGVDVTHPGVGRQGNSIATVVANTDIEASRYEASIKVQLPSEERVVYMVEALSERLLAFFRENKKRPEHIIVYRDGISESEFLTTMREEVSSVRAACLKLDEKYKPTISYVVTQKRHHTRFFVTNPRDGVGRPLNVPPGTVVEESVSSQSHTDFFLASQTGAIGTTRPCHYHVLYDTWEINSNEWQQLLFSLCHLYCRCNKSVSLPAPVFYAHLACARASVHSNAIQSMGSSRDRSERYDSEYGGSARGRSTLESTRTLQTELVVNDAAPRMYFV